MIDMEKEHFDKAWEIRKRIADIDSCIKDLNNARANIVTDTCSLNFGLEQAMGKDVFNNEVKRFTDSLAQRLQSLKDELEKEFEKL